ncbi:MAG: hypothetical protein ABW000_09875 [Actinoplanes sp.]
MYPFRTVERNVGFGRELPNLPKAERRRVEEAVFLGRRVVVLACDPGRVAADLPVELPAGRDLTVKRTSGFLDLRTRVEDQVRAFHHSTERTAQAGTSPADIRGEEAIRCGCATGSPSSSASCC